MNTFVYIETKSGKPIPGSLELLSPAQSLGEATAVLVGSDLSEAAQTTAAYGVPVLIAETSDCCPDVLASVLEQLIHERNPQLVCSAPPSPAKTVRPALLSGWAAAASPTLLP